jgi:hypothetical protein
VVQLLTAENQERLDRFFEGIRHPSFSLLHLATGDSLIPVGSSKEVDCFRKCAAASYGWISHNASFGFSDLTFARIKFLFFLAARDTASRRLCFYLQ